MFRILSSLRVAVICLVFLAVLVFVGTLYQVEHGLYAAQQRFFSTWFFLVLGVIPFPGGQLVMAVLFINLFSAMLSHFHYGLRQSGIILIHLGLLLLLGGGFLVHLHAEESFLTLLEGEGSNVSSGYHTWELSLWKGHDEVRQVTAVDPSALQTGEQVQLERPAVQLDIVNYLPHCRAFVAGTDPDAGIARLEEQPRNKEPNEDIPGIVLNLSDGSGQDQTLTLFGAEELPRTVTLSGEPWKIQLRRERSQLPVAVSLIDFKKEMHPNSTIPKSYSSVVLLDTPVGERKAHIQMNEPLRYQGYTLYQASFMELPDGQQASTFAVVKNYGRMLPYVASIMTFIGLLVHFSIEITARRRLASA